MATFDSNSTARTVEAIRDWILSLSIGRLLLVFAALVLVALPVKCQQCTGGDCSCDAEGLNSYGIPPIPGIDCTEFQGVSQQEICNGLEQLKDGAGLLAATVGLIPGVPTPVAGIFVGVSGAALYEFWNSGCGGEYDDAMLMPESDPDYW
jgi:hypothetical protein